MPEKIRILHYLNQFFGGVGGEEQANVPVQVKDGAVGPGRALQQVVRDRATVVATVIGGDNYVAENQQESRQALSDAIRRFKPAVLVAGPAFDAGRYGLACALMCQAAQQQKVPAVTGMHPENTGVLTLGRELIVAPTGTDVAAMQAIMSSMGRLALKLASGQELGPALEEGYIPRGVRKPVMRDRSGATRAVDMIEAKVLGMPFVSEVAPREFTKVGAPPPVVDLTKATVALITTGGLVPKGNPDRLESGRTTEVALRYSLAGLKEFIQKDWEGIHTGFHSGAVNERDINYILPLRSVRQLEARGEIGKIYPYFFSTAGNGMAVRAAKRIGEGIAKELTAENVDAVLMVAT